jgi:arabinan endo-1,5-alpha-L-arabinosidase
LGDISELKSDIVLPVTGPFASAVQWASSNPAVISTSGKVTQPGAGQSNATVTLTATVGLSGTTSTKTFTAIVKANTPAIPSAVYSFEDNLAEKSGVLATGTVVGAKIDTAGGAVSYTTGSVGKALILDGASGVKLANNLIVGNSYSISLWLNPSALTVYTSALFGFAGDESWINLAPGGLNGVADSLLWARSPFTDGVFGSTIPKDKWTHVVTVVDKGTLTVYLNGKKANSISSYPNVFSSGSTSTFHLGVNYWDAPYKGMIDELKIFNEAISPSDVTLLYGESAK